MPVRDPDRRRDRARPRAADHARPSASSRGRGPGAVGVLRALPRRRGRIAQPLYRPDAPRAHAAGLLRSSDASLAEVAARAGYAIEFSFSKAFKRAFGIAPGAYRGLADAVPAPRGHRSAG